MPGGALNELVMVATWVHPIVYTQYTTGVPFYRVNSGKVQAFLSTCILYLLTSKKGVYPAEHTRCCPSAVGMTHILEKGL